MKRRHRDDSRPVDLAWQVLLYGGPPGDRPDPPNEPPDMAALLAEPAALRMVFDFDDDGYVIRGSMVKHPGPWPPIAPDATESETPP